MEGSCAVAFLLPKLVFVIVAAATTGSPPTPSILVLPNAQAICMDLTYQAGSVPDWIQLLPAGEVIEGRDGRTWRNSAPDKVAHASNTSDQAIPIDVEHSTELKAPHGDEAPAHGWIEPGSFTLRNGALWAYVQWNQAGRELIQSRAYRYISPVFEYAPESNEVLRIVSVALTNRPNLRMQALNQQSSLPSSPPPTNLILDARIPQLLGLPGEASMEEVHQALQRAQQSLQPLGLSLQSSPSEVVAAKERLQTPDPQLYVSAELHRADLARARAAEQRLREREQQERQQAIDTALQTALCQGKILPKQEAAYRVLCSTESGLTHFRSLMDDAPERLAPTPASTLATSSSQARSPLDLSEVERAICQKTGKDPETFARHLHQSQSLFGLT